jgi:hypothetical protein
VAVVLLTGLVAFGTTAKAACSCGPDFCQDDPRVPNALRAKKQELRDAGYPDRLVTLIDRGDQCIARISRAPVSFTMWIIHPDGNKETVPWSMENERNGMNKVRSGEIKRFWISNARQAFSCCGQPRYDQRPDYDSADELVRLPQLSARLRLLVERSHPSMAVCQPAMATRLAMSPKKVRSFPSYYA